MSNHSVLVTGGAGYVGSHTLISLLESGSYDDVIVLDSCANAYIQPNSSKPAALQVVEELTNKTIKFYDVDITDKGALREVFRKNLIKCVVHFAALKAVGESCHKPLQYYQNNVGGTCTLLEVMSEFGVKKLVYSSSCTVYGDPQKLPLTESHPTGQGISSPYGKTKHFTEQIMQDLTVADDEWRVISLRYFNPVGAHPSGKIGEDPLGPPNNLMPFISQVAVGVRDKLTVFGRDYDTADGTGVRDYIHVMDLAEGHVAALRLLDRPALPSLFTAINLGTGKGHSVLEVVQKFEEVSGAKVPYEFGTRRAGDVAANWADTALASQLLGWTASRTLGDMCADTWRWQSAHPHGYRS